ncbi:electron transfer flavoprotein subunit beta/FixA family protein [Alteromonas sp. a30]|uniref:electron transfer flavoprotein subunit beta/FixA family protein n=1 Tax=Alteromonas sp. a30 TaxID=2730917 RepID=UPI002280228C|nr:electron transfer flavoprotein subunit beta/FixA family protein [Alteromonas sp. a30]MCY7296483.1 electron transfer flavoprotein subunit beta/FixA family protein [Alteromonas sp. a30]
MKILVPLKQVDDPGNTEINGQYNFLTAEAGMSKIINPFCHVALEEAVRLKEKGIASEVVLLCFCEKDPEKTLRKALAGGADRAIDVRVPSEKQLSPLSLAKLMQKVVEKEQPDLVLVGKQAVDYDNNQTGQMLAALLGWNQANSVSRLSVEGSRIEVDCEADDGEVSVCFTLPAVLTVDLCLNEQRAASLAHVMKARSKPIEKLNVNDLLATQMLYSGVSYLDTLVPKNETTLTLLNSVDALAAEIRRHLVS